MEAKTWQETVLTEKQLKEKIGPTITVGEQAKKSLKLQAEISFKAGMQKVVNDFTIAVATSSIAREQVEAVVKVLKKYEKFLKEKGLDG